MAEMPMKVMFVWLVVGCLLQNSPTVNAGAEDVMQGTWELLLQNAGVSAMHMALLYTNRVLLIDHTGGGASNITLPDPMCKQFTLTSPEVPLQCWAHSVEYDIVSNTVRPLHLYTDTWASSGTFASNGTLISTGGHLDGAWKTRYYIPCNNSACDWVEAGTPDLIGYRWFSSNQLLPDTRIIVVGGVVGANAPPTYEFIPSRYGDNDYQLTFLRQTDDQFKIPFENNNLYPFLHLSSDGNLFIFANRDSILFDYTKNQVVKTFPTIPGGSRNYPSSGSSIMFPLNFTDNFQRVEIMICGGAVQGTFTNATSNKVFTEALNTCGRMEITSPNPQWAMEEMPGPRVMGDMLILLTGEILIINGAKNGSAGPQNARKPVLTPWLYRADQPLGKRFTILGATTIPRMYQSTAIIIPDGRVLVAGSNPNDGSNFIDLADTKTELSVEAYSPYYLHPQYSGTRVNIVNISSRDVKYGTIFTVLFNVSTRQPGPDMRYYVYAPPFNTHSVSMNQRMLSLAPFGPIQDRPDGLFYVNLRAPPNTVAAPSAYYLLTVVRGGVPSKAEWIRFCYCG